MRWVFLLAAGHAASALSVSRRGVGQLLAGGAAAASAPALAAGSVAPCPANSNNCFSTASTGKTAVPPWEWPAGTSRADAVKELKAVVEAYPQAGQGNVDLGGWSYGDDRLAADGTARLEFRSGIGKFAKFFNGGQPFVDDLDLVVTDRVAVRSASRVGDSDFGVNAKRLNYIAARLREKGWRAPSF